MFIKKITKSCENEPYTDADIIISDGEFELLCHACPCENNVGDTNFTILPLGCSDIMTSDKSEYKAQKLEDDYYSYKLQGKLINVEDCIGTVQIGSIIISNVSWVPRDIKIGEFIEFTVSRLDVE